ncbi:hypothetical protein C2S53_018213 [Perilla frutescens var. hirtella]|uniref:Ribonuclease H1 N-terminal domain-containing protein n=1 Tax=Perilla frutescens var. hirtella TaxID=608512 RepID=A0AAD4J289_PERFH|nr:hypothetical protein C2S53_018213 [Perilla frutescens var. hirtella]
MAIQNKPAIFYVVFKGVQTGIYGDWLECAPNIIVFKGTVYKGFRTKKDAVEAYQSFMRQHARVSDEATAISDSCSLSRDGSILSEELLREWKACSKKMVRLIWLNVMQVLQNVCNMKCKCLFLELCVMCVRFV